MSCFSSIFIGNPLSSVSQVDPGAGLSEFRHQASLEKFKNPSNALRHYKQRTPSAPVIQTYALLNIEINLFSNMKLRSVIGLIGKFSKSSLNQTPSTPLSQWKHICNPFKVAVEHVSKTPLWSWKCDYPGVNPWEFRLISQVWSNHHHKNNGWLVKVMRHHKFMRAFELNCNLNRSLPLLLCRGKSLMLDLF